MKEKYQLESGCGIDEASDIAIRLKVLAGEIYNARTSMEWLKRQMFASTASGEYLDYIALQRGLTRRAATKARGQLTFYLDNAVNYSVAIPKGTTVATDGDTPVRVCTSETGEIKQGELSVTVNAEAEQAGYSGNINFGTAVVPVNMPAGIASVVNLSTFVGGDDEETDSTLRERIRKSYTVQPNGANKAFYEQLALSVDGVDKAGVVPRLNGADSIGVFVCGKGGQISDEALETVRSVMEENRGVNLYVTVAKAAGVYYDLDVKVTAKTDYSEAEVKELITDAFNAYVNSVDAGGRVYLSALGKYLLDTGCIENYEFDLSMQNKSVPASQYFMPGDVLIEVT